MPLAPGRGLRAFTQGARIIRSPALRRHVIVPTLLSLLIIGTGSYVAWGHLADLGRRFIDWLPDWLAFLDVLLIPLLYLLGVLAAAWCFALLAVLISSPFLGTLSSAVERHVGGTAPDSSRSLWLELIAGFGREARKLLYYLPRLLAVVLISLIPALNVVAPLVWLVFGAWITAVQFCDYPTENRGQPFAQTLRQLHANRTATITFGLCASAALSIPLLNFLLIPVAVAGGTLLMRELADAQP